MSISTISGDEQVPFLRGSSVYPGQSGPNLLQSLLSRHGLRSSSIDRPLTILRIIDTQTSFQATPPLITVSCTAAADLPVALVTATPITPTEFTPFMRLAPELRIMIWEASVIARIISFTPGGGKGPGGLFANRESRKIYKKYYEFCRGVSHPDFHPDFPDIPSCLSFKVHVNWETDIIHINPFRDRFVEYLQTAPDAEQKEWQNWQESVESHPTSDWAFVSLFDGQPNLLNKIKKIAFDLDSRFGVWPTRFTWMELLNESESALSNACPMLKEILIVQDDKIGANVEDLIISTSGTGEEVRAMTEVVAEIDLNFQSARAGTEEYKWWNHGVAVRFVTNERHTSRVVEEIEESGDDSAEDNLSGDGILQAGDALEGAAGDAYETDCQGIRLNEVKSRFDRKIDCKEWKSS